MATKQKQIPKSEVSKQPIYNKSSKMNNYEIVYDESVSQYRTGFYSNKLMDKKSQFDTIYEVEAGFEHRLDLISYKFYETATFDWAIADANNISDPIKNVKVGTILRIPARNIL